MNNLTVLHYRISGIDNTEIAITPKENTFSISQEELLFNVSVRVKLLDDIEQIKINCIVKFLQKANNELLLQMSINCFYLIKDFTKTITKTDSTWHTPDGLLIGIISNTVDISRGYIYAKTENTYLGGIFLGSFDPVSFIQKMKDRKKPDIKE